ncbi:MAG: hypothetical protein IJD22_07505 [Clostridia bacterium]|nr:hypothetical protein [Clostridia bacterium]
MRTATAGAAIYSVTHQSHGKAMLCLLALILFLLPFLFERLMGISLSQPMEISIILFIFSSEILGEVFGFYMMFPLWDSLLHGVMGFIASAMGFALPHILCRDSYESTRLSPLCSAVVAFCFSMTVGTLWELFEFCSDSLLHLDMQKDTVIDRISSVSLGHRSAGEAVSIEGISEVILKADGGNTVSLSSYGINGYLDVGLSDTMGDLLINLLGAVIFCTLGYIHLKSQSKARIAGLFIPKVNKKRKNP